MSSTTPRLAMIGYGAWPVAKRMPMLLKTLQTAGIRRLADVRLMPCSSDLEPGRPYGPKPWNLQANGAGLAGALLEANVAYEWIVELGNPQRQDPAMAILREHLADEAADWPVHRGLRRLAEIVRREPNAVAILCACADGDHCHRKVVAEALRNRHFEGGLTLVELNAAKASTRLKEAD